MTLEPMKGTTGREHRSVVRGPSSALRGRLIAVNEEVGSKQLLLYTDTLTENKDVNQQKANSFLCISQSQDNLNFAIHSSSSKPSVRTLEQYNLGGLGVSHRHSSLG
jgi:hypothetical protein